MANSSPPKVRSVSAIGMSAILVSISLGLILFILPIIPFPVPGLIVAIFVAIYLIATATVLFRKSWGYPLGTVSLLVLFFMFIANIMDSLTRPGSAVADFVLSLVAVVGTPLSVIFGIQGFRETRGKIPAGSFKTSKLGALALIALGVVLGGILTANLASMSTGGAGVNLSGPPDTTVTVEEKNTNFLTKEIKVKSGNVLVLVKNSDSAVHTFTIAELNVNVENPAMRTSLAAFTANNAGTFKFYCSIPGHREAGMEGTIVIGG